MKEAFFLLFLYQQSDILRSANIRLFLKHLFVAAKAGVDSLHGGHVLLLQIGEHNLKDAGQRHGVIHGAVVVKGLDFQMFVDGIQLIVMQAGEQRLRHGQGVNIGVGKIHPRLIPCFTDEQHIKAVGVVGNQDVIAAEFLELADGLGRCGGIGHHAVVDAGQLHHLLRDGFALGRDLGIVMAKGVLIGVVCCVTVLPAMVLVFDKAIEKTRHRPLVKSLDKPSAFITKHYKAWVVIFLILLFPSIYGNNHTQIYYNIARSLPATLDCNVANDEVKAQFDVSNMHIVMMDRDMDSKQKKKMMEEIGNVKGVKSTISMSSLLGPTIPESMIPENLRSMLQSDEYELAFVSSEYESATDEVNEQVKAIDKIVKSYDKDGMVIGEAPLMKDLQDVTDADLVNVNVLSIGAIFIIILLIFKSISLPIILVAVIEFAIMLNMAIPYYQGTSLPFVASIVIGAIQLGATVDYAILMTTRYQKERQNGKDKKEAISIAHKTSMPSIISSGLSFFAATFGVACY